MEAQIFQTQNSTEGQLQRFVAFFDDEERIVSLPTRWLQSLLDNPKGYSVKSVKTYAQNLRYFCETIASSDRWAHLTLDEILRVLPVGMIDQYLKSLQVGSLKSATIRNRDVTLKAFFEWMTTADAGRVRQKSGYENGLKSLPPHNRMPRFVTKQQVIQLLNSIHNESQRALIHFIFDSGVRVSEVPRILKSDIDALEFWPEHMCYLPLLIRGSKARGGELVKERYTLISRAVYSRIKRYHNTPKFRFSKFGDSKGKPTFLTVHGKALTERSISKLMRDAAIRAEIDPRLISPHNLRHGAALSILKSEHGKDYLEKLVIIQKQFGHSHITSTEQYTQIPPQLFTQLNETSEIKTRFEEAQEIFDRTFLPQKMHKERRGHKNAAAH
ncbi:MAG: tyrosine-type recombinase/integrase [Bdellovibrionia bacterium]